MSYVSIANINIHLCLLAPTASHQSAAKLFVFPASEFKQSTQRPCTEIVHLFFSMSTMLSPSRNNAHGPLSWPAVTGMASDGTRNRNAYANNNNTTSVSKFGCPRCSRHHTNISCTLRLFSHIFGLGWNAQLFATESLARLRAVLSNTCRPRHKQQSMSGKHILPQRISRTVSTLSSRSPNNLTMFFGI